MQSRIRFLLIFVLLIGFGQAARSAQLDVALTGGLPLSQPRWQRVALTESGVQTLAVLGDRIAVGGGDFVSMHTAPPTADIAGTTARVSHFRVNRGEVRDLCFFDGQRLLVATAQGLYVTNAEGALEAVRFESGNAVEKQTRLSCHGNAQAAATQSGIYFAVAENPWQALGGALRFRSAQALQWVDVAMSREGQEAAHAAVYPQLWILAQGELWWSEQTREDTLGEPVRIPGLDRFANRTAVDLLVAEQEIFVLYENGVAVGQRRVDGSVLDLDESNPSSSWNWVWLDLALPPAAQAQRLFFASGLYWLATDQGLLWTTHPSLAWRRADAPLGFEAIHDLHATGDSVWVAAESGVWQSVGLAPAAPRPTLEGVDLGTSAPRPTGNASSRLAQEPDFAAVRAAALTYLRLERRHLDELTERVAQRGVLPKFVLSTGRGGGKSFTRNYDETYTSGATHSLRDWERERENGWDVSASFSWDFGDTVYASEMIDVAQDRRKTLEFRDQVLDELSQLYFERQRVLIDLASHVDVASPAPSAETLRLQIRAQELSAGIDAWTGGWFSRALSEVPNSIHPTSP